MIPNSCQQLDQFTMPPGFRGRPPWFVQLWWLVQATLFAMSPQFMYPWRRFLLRLFGASVGPNVLLRPSVTVTFPWKVSIGANSWIGDNVVLYSLGEIEIHDNVVISQGSYLCTGSHDYRKKSFDIFSTKIVVESEAWLAANVFVAPDVVIGTGAVVGACSGVFHTMPAGMVCFGTPAKPVHPRCPGSSKAAPDGGEHV